VLPDSPSIVHVVSDPSSFLCAVAATTVSSEARTGRAISLSAWLGGQDRPSHKLVCVVVIGDERFAQPLGPTVIPGQGRHTEAHGFVHPTCLDVGGRPVGNENLELPPAVVADDRFRGVVRAAEVDNSRITAEDG